MKRFFKKLLTPPLIVVAALIMFFEEWVWDRLVAFMAWVGRWRLVHAVESRIATLPPYPAMALFLLPGLLLLPVKLGALYFMAKGHVAMGLGIIIAAKIAGTAVVARMFTLCKPTLLSVPWFMRVYAAITKAKNWLYTRIKALPAWQAAVRFKRATGRFLARFRGSLLRRRWQAIRHRLGRSKSDAGKAETPDSP